MKHRSFVIQKNLKPGILPLDTDPKISVSDYGEIEWQAKTTHEATAGWPGLNYTEEMYAIEIHTEDIIQLIVKEQVNCERLFGGRMKHVIVGFEQMEKLHIEFDRRRPMFSIPTQIELAKNGIFQICNMMIHICPWFDGILVLPELKEQKLAL